jgi:hypothetical protein
LVQVVSESRQRRGGRPALGQHPHRRRGIRARRHFGDQLFDLALGAVRGAPQECLAVLTCQVWGQLRNRGQVKAPLAQDREEPGVLPCGACGGDAQIRLELGEVQHLRAVGEHRRRGLAGVELARIHFPNVGDEIGFDSPWRVELARS